MEYSGRTPQEAIDLAKKFNNESGGLFFATEHPRRHPNRRFSAGYVKGSKEHEDRVKNNCTIVDGYYVVKQESDASIKQWMWG